MNTTDKLVKALEDIAAMTYDSWTNGARAGDIAHQALAAYNSAQRAEGAADEHGIRAFAAYLKDCEECAIVPDVAGAFNAGRQAGHEAGRQQGMEQVKIAVDGPWRKLFWDVAAHRERP